MRGSDVSRNFHFLQFPQLQNHVLLRELNLVENGLDNIEPITSSWLPLLQKLNLSCNWYVNCVLLQTPPTQ